MKKIWTLIKISTVLSLVILLSGCFHETKNNITKTPEETSAGIVREEIDTGIVGINETGEKNVYEINMVAKKFEFDPHTIVVNKGEKVMLNIVSTDVAHGFSLPDFDINIDLPVDKIVKVEFVADKTGEFEFECSVFCGSGHRDMKGRVIVEE